MTRSDGDPPPQPIRAAIALGANLGDRAATIAEALSRLNDPPRLRVLRVSQTIENPAVGGPANSPAFLNAAAIVETTLSPRELLRRLLDIERSLGRQREVKWAPRTIDLDLLLYGDRVLAEDDLHVPHPRMHERAFVLNPLAEIAPDLAHPVLGRTIAQLRAALSQ